MKKNLKKFFAVALAVAMVAAQLVVPAVAANGDYYCNVCGAAGEKGDHLSDRDLAATCSTAAYEIYECDNGNCPGTIAIKVGNPDASLHVESAAVPADPSDCLNAGTYEYVTCLKCGQYKVNGVWGTEALTIDPADGHVPGTPVEDPAPDCENDGVSKVFCVECDALLSSTPVTHTGHTWVPQPELKATCKEPGHSAYELCACGAERGKTVYPVAQDHNLHVNENKSQAPDCATGTDGWVHYECDNENCRYYKNGNTPEQPGGIRETVAANHDLAGSLTVAKAATCLVDGYKAYKQCSVCDQYFAANVSDTENSNASALDYDTEVKLPALGHVGYAFAYVAPTCTTQGYTDGIACANGAACDHVTDKVMPNGDKILVGSDPIPANGHTLALVQKLDDNAIRCEVEYVSVTHKVCTVCEKLFAENTDDDDNVDAVEIAKSTVYATRQHNKITRIANEGGCVAADTLITTCTQPHCDFIKTSVDTDVSHIPGHTFEHHDAVAPDCLNDGTYAHEECTECGLLFEDGADTMAAVDTAIDAADLVDPALRHDFQTVQAKIPTYNAAGATAGKACSRCNEPDPQEPSVVLPELRETINFKYTVEGVAGAADAVNSGYVVLKVYFDVLADTADLEEYESDVLANIYAIDFALNFDDDAFNLTDVYVAEGLFDAASFTAISDDMGGNVKISQDMAGNTDGKVFRGEDNLFATLVFQVEDEADARDYTFELDDTFFNVVHPEEETYNESSEDNIITVETPVVTIAVKMLGDVNGDGKFTSHDTLKLSQQLKDLEADYNTVMDMDKDGIITTADMILMRQACVGNEDYKDYHVDPYAVTEEVA